MDKIRSRARKTDLYTLFTAHSIRHPVPSRQGYGWWDEIRTRHQIGLAGIGTLSLGDHSLHQLSIWPPFRERGREEQRGGDEPPEGQWEENLVYKVTEKQGMELQF